MKRIFLFAGLCLAGTACKNPDLTKPKAGFDVTTAALVNIAWEPQNTSTSATNYQWQWGDGTISTGQTPSHTYTIAGPKRILLSATGLGGTDTVSKVVQVAFDQLTATVVGRYKGKLYKYPYGYTSYTPTKRDTSIEVTTTAAQTVSASGRIATYYGSTYPWEGHKPLRTTYTFVDLRASLGTTFQVQKEQNGDSIFISRKNGGLGGGDVYLFYGKK